MRIEFYRHSINEDDIRETKKVLRSIFLTTGKVCTNFEDIFSSYTNINHTVALSSCTAAIQLALQALEIGKDCEVITTPMTFIATSTAILHAGAVPVLVDIDKDSGLIDPNKVEEAVTSRTKAILPVHLYGSMADMISLKKIADKHNLYLIEDAAHCIEGERDGVRPGHLSDAVCYSFYATKNLTCGEGGALSTNNKALAERVRSLRLHGMNKEAADRYTGTYQHWDMLDLGWKYNLDDIHASLLIKQIERLDENLEKRKIVYQQYAELFNDLSEVRLPVIYDKPAYHLFTIQVPKSKRDPLLNFLGHNNIGCAVNYRAIHTLTWFQKYFKKSNCNELRKSEDFGAKTVSLPFYPDLKPVEISHIVTTVKNSLNSIPF